MPREACGDVVETRIDVRRRLALVRAHVGADRRAHTRVADARIVVASIAQDVGRWRCIAVGRVDARGAEQKAEPVVVRPPNPVRPRRVAGIHEQRIEVDVADPREPARYGRMADNRVRPVPALADLVRRRAPYDAIDRRHLCVVPLHVERVPVPSGGVAVERAVDDGRRRVALVGRDRPPVVCLRHVVQEDAVRDGGRGVVEEDPGHAVTGGVVGEHAVLHGCRCPGIERQTGPVVGDIAPDYAVPDGHRTTSREEATPLAEGGIVLVGRRATRDDEAIDDGVVCPDHHVVCPRAASGRAAVDHGRMNRPVPS